MDSTPLQLQKSTWEEELLVILQRLPVQLLEFCEESTVNRYGIKVEIIIRFITK